LEHDLAKLDLGALSSDFQLKYTETTNNALTPTQMIRADGRRWALIFSQLNNSVSGITSQAGGGGNVQFNLLANETKGPFYFTQVGPWVQQEFWLPPTVAAVTVGTFEILYVPVASANESLEAFQRDHFDGGAVVGPQNARGIRATRRERNNI